MHIKDKLCRLTAKAPKDQTKLLKPIPSMLHSRRRCVTSTTLLNPPLAPPSTLLLVVLRGTAKLAVVLVVKVELVVEIFVGVVVGCGPG